jgi:hypothetical protein
MSNEDMISNPSIRVNQAILMFRRNAQTKAEFGHIEKARFPAHPRQEGANPTHPSTSLLTPRMAFGGATLAKGSPAAAGCN